MTDNQNKNRLPVVAIVGRPNVGKSTLFNRIIRRREAIVDDQPGITRDRKYADAEWEGISFALVDTGGYVLKSKNVIDAGVVQQVQIAIEEADLILFLVDAKAGITDVDGEVARLLRKGRRSCILVVNKVDEKVKELLAAEFIRLGLGEPSMVAGMTGRGLGDLLSLVVEKLGPRPNEKTPSDQDTVRLAVVGRPNVGKSTFVNLILGEERILVTDVPGTTRDSIDIHIQYREHNFILIDTAGLRRRSRVTERVEYYSTLRAHQVLEQCDVACIMTDAGEEIAQQDMRIVQEALKGRKGIVLVVNKWDLIENDPARIEQWNQKIEQRFRGMSFIPILTVSCKTGLRVNQVLETVWKVAQERGKRVSSQELNRFLENLNRRIQPPAVQGKRIRIPFGAQVGVDPPVFVFFSNYPNLIEESYRKFLENQIREQFGFQGVSIVLSFKRKT